MSIPAKQTGYSTEASLLYEILRQLDKLAGVVAVSGGGGLGNFVTTDTDQSITAQKDFSVVAGPAATFTSSTGNTVNVTATTGSGVYSTSVDGPGVEAFSVNDPGVFAYSTNSAGLFAHSVNYIGFVVDSFNPGNNFDLATFNNNGTPVATISKTGKATVDGLIYKTAVLISGLDLDTVIQAGFYSGDSLLQAPTNEYYFLTVETHVTTGYVHQTLSHLFTNKIYTRLQNGGAWQPWAEIVTSSSLTGKLVLQASTTLDAILNLPVGPAPTTPADGDVWLESNTLTGLKIRLGGVTRTITIT